MYYQELLKKRFWTMTWLYDTDFFYLLFIYLKPVPVSWYGTMETHLPCRVSFERCKHSSFNKGDPSWGVALFIIFCNFFCKQTTHCRNKSSSYLDKQERYYSMLGALPQRVQTLFRWWNQLLTAVFLREDHGDPYLVCDQCCCTFHSNVATTNDNSISTRTWFHRIDQLIRIINIA